MKNSKRIFVLLIMFTAVLVFTMLTVTAAVANTPQTYKTTDDGVQLEVKYKKIKTNKVTFNANGGKIGAKTAVSRNIKKGATIKKFPTTPKMEGYAFKGWYTKKTGGKKK